MGKSWFEVIVGCLTLLIGGFVLWFVVSLVFAFFASLLWNWLCPMLFGFPEISYLQMFGLMLLIKLMLPSVKINNKKND